MQNNCLQTGFLSWKKMSCMFPYAHNGSVPLFAIRFKVNYCIKCQHSLFTNVHAVDCALSVQAGPISLGWSSSSQDGKPSSMHVIIKFAEFRINGCASCLWLHKSPGYGAGCPDLRARDRYDFWLHELTWPHAVNKFPHMQCNAHMCILIEGQMQLHTRLECCAQLHS